MTIFELQALLEERENLKSELDTILGFLDTISTEGHEIQIVVQLLHNSNVVDDCIVGVGTTVLTSRIVARVTEIDNVLNRMGVYP